MEPCQPTLFTSEAPSVPNGAIGAEENCLTDRVSTVHESASKKPFAFVNILPGGSIKMLFDSGSESTILSKNLLDELSIDYTMKHCKHQLSGVEGTSLTVLGEVDMHIKFNGAVGKTKFAILEERDIAIIGMKTMDEFGIDISPRNKTFFGYSRLITVVA